MTRFGRPVESGAIARSAGSATSLRELDFAGTPAYLAGALLGALAAGTKAVLLYSVGVDTVFTVFVPAVALAAWLGGFRAGLVATLVSAVLNGALLMPGELIEASPPDQIRTVLFVAGGLLIAALSGRLRAAARALAEERRATAQSRDQLQAVLDAASDAVVLEDRSYRFVFANHEAARLLRLDSPAAVVAETAEQRAARLQLLDEGGHPLARDELPSRRLLAGEQDPGPITFRVRERSTGRESAMTLQSSPVSERGGPVELVVNVFRDVGSERRQQAVDRFLADATSVVAGMVDEREGMTELARIAVDQLVDLCCVDIISADGQAVETVTVGRIPQGQAVAHDRSPIRPDDQNPSSGPAAVMGGGSPELVVELDASARSEEIRAWAKAAMAQVGEVRSYLSAPITSRGRPLGAVTLFTGASGQWLDKQDLAAAIELGARVGAAIEFTRLYHTATARGAELMALLSSMREGVLVYDSQGQLVLSNPASRALLGRAPPRRLEQLADVLGIESDGHVAAALTESAPLELRGRGGLWLEVSAYRAVIDGESSNGRDTGQAAPEASQIVVVRDITEARESEAARDAFMGLLSHELRTPITTIYGGTRLLERRLDDAEHRELVSDVRSEAERLYRLVEDLLVMTRVGRGGVEIGDEPILLQRLLSSTVHIEEARWPGLVVRLDVPMGLPTVRGDPTYVEQILRNFITNAAKYGGVDVPIDVTVEEAGDSTLIRVLDRGPGIDPQEANHLFDLFYRGAATSGTASGAGIGLFVCRALAKAMDGKVWCRPRDGGGAEFGFSLPILELEEGEI